MASCSSSSDAVKQAQICALRVPVDCEGCRKKVTKIVNSINGVESCEVDIKQQKVVVKGNVDVGVLLKTLGKKTGKHAELWPEDQKIRKTKKKKAIVQDEAEEGQLGKENRAEEQRVSKFEEDVKGDSETGQREEDKPKMGLDAPPSTVVGEGDKKKSKGQTGNEKIHIRVESPPLDHKDNPPPPITNIPPRQQTQVNGQTISTPPLPDYIPPRHPIPSTSLPANIITATASACYRHPRPQPVYTMSYSSAPQAQTSQAAVRNPRISDPPRHPGLRPSYYYTQPVCSMSYNVAPRPQTSAYSYQGGSSSYYPQPYHYYNDEVDYDAYGWYRQQQPESIGMFSDENPNACLIM